MKIQDLRIGNNVHFNGKNKEVGTVTGISKSLDVLNDRVFINNRVDISYSDSEIQGITITEKMLIIAGFEEVELAGGCFEKKGFFIYIEDFECGYSNWFDSKVQYIHQLQNIYFSIFNEEIVL